MAKETAKVKNQRDLPGGRRARIREVSLRTILAVALCVAAALAAQVQPGTPARKTPPAAAQPAPQAGPRPQQPMIPKPGQPSGQRPEEGSFVITDVVTEILVPVTVTDPNDEYVVDLKAEDFHLFDNTIRQNINVELAETPLSLVVLLSQSANLEGLMPDVKRLGGLVTSLVMGAEGEAAVLTYDHRVQVVQPFTTDHEKVEKVFKDLEVGSSGASLTDAIVRGLTMLRDKLERRKVILAIGEGRDTTSETDFGFVLREAQRSNVTFYSVGLSTLAASFSRRPPNPGPSPFPPGSTPMPPGHPTAVPAPMDRTQRGDLLTPLLLALKGVKGVLFDNPLEAYAEGTGGLHVGKFVKKDVQAAISRIGRDLRSQYLISYRPNNLNQGGVHTIAVKVDRRGVKVRTRPGYFNPAAGPQETPASSSSSANSASNAQ